MGFSSLAGMGHEVMPHMQRRFPERCHSLWTIGTDSPAEMMVRLGPARSRILVYCDGWAAPVLLSHHQGARGDTVLELGLSEQLAAGFRHQQSLDALQRYFSGQELQLLQCQLYSDAGAEMQLQHIQPIGAEQARYLDPRAEALLANAEPMLIETRDGRDVGYRMLIPVHTDP
jgi:hypothetical protein